MRCYAVAIAAKSRFMDLEVVKAKARGIARKRLSGVNTKHNNDAECLSFTKRVV